MWLLILRLAVMAVAVVASYYVVERPIRRGSLAPCQLLVWGGAAAIGCLGLVLVLTAGPGAGLAALVRPVASRPRPRTRRRDGHPRRRRRPHRVRAPATGAVPTTLAAVGPKPGQLPTAPGTVPPTVAATTPATPPRVLVVGDSGAWFLGEAMAAEAPRVGAVVLSRGWIGCGVAARAAASALAMARCCAVLDGCADWPTRWQEDLQSFRPDRVLLLLSWPGLGDRKIQGKWRHPCSPEFDAYYGGEVNQALAVLASTGARVYIATAPYFTANGAPAEARNGSIA